MARAAIPTSSNPLLGRAAASPTLWNLQSGRAATPTSSNPLLGRAASPTLSDPQMARATTPASSNPHTGRAGTPTSSSYQSVRLASPRSTNPQIGKAETPRSSNPQTGSAETPAPSNPWSEREETPTGTTPVEWATRKQPSIPPKSINYIEKAKGEMNWIEDIQKVLELMEAFQKETAAIGVVNELEPVAGNLRKKLVLRKANFQKYFDAMDSNNYSET